MKLVNLSLNQPAATTMDRLPLSLPFSASDLLWRYPLGAAAFHRPPTSSSALVVAAAAGQIALGELRAQLPNTLASNPRIWSREDVSIFLRWCEREYDLRTIDMELFQMNGKALCLLTKSDLGQRCPGAGDVLHNVIQLLLRESNQVQRYMPTSPLTPTSRHYPLSPSQPHAPWALTFNPEFHNTLVQQGNSVTLSPAPSVDSQSGSPQHANQGSHQSDSDEDSFQEGRVTSPPPTPGFAPTFMQMPTSSTTTNAQRESRSEQIQVTPSHIHLAAAAAAAAASAAASASNSAPPPSPSFIESPNGHGSSFSVKREFFPNDHSSEPNTNGRLLWDFLQQLLNDPGQRYTNYIAWKNHETGVFKIVDPAGLAKLWGIQKNHLSMNYDKMSRALRYYYRVNILRKVQGERHCYQFLRNPIELKSIKNMSLLKQQISPTRVTAQQHQDSAQQPLGHVVGTRVNAQQHQDSQQPLGHVIGVSIKSEMPDRVSPNAEEPESAESDQQATDLTMEHPADFTMEHPTDLTMDQATDLSMEHAKDLRLAPVPVNGEKIPVKPESEND